MDKKVRSTLIGAFVVGGVALVVIAVVLFGSGRLFRHTKEFALYFDSSVNGLRVGAPVKFRGVEIGSVRKILLQIDPDMKVQRIPVVIEVELEKLTSRGTTGAVLSDPVLAQAAIDRGLRGQLQLESFVTGLLFIGLDFFPGSPANLVQPPGSAYQEIPTLPTTLEQAQDAATRILAKLEEIDFKALLESVTQVVNGVNQLVNAPELKSSLHSLEQIMPKIDEAITGLRDLTTSLNASAKSLSDDLQQTSAEARVALKNAGAAMQQAEATMRQAETALTGMQEMIAADSPAFYELHRSLKEVSAAARSLRLLANYLQRNPRALIFGKPEGREE